MGYDVNFALLGQPVDIAGAVQAGYQHGRALRQQGLQDRAFQLLATDPNSPEGRRLLVEAGHPEQSRQFREWGIEDRRREMYRAAFGGGTAPAPTSAAFPAANTPAAPAGAPPAAIPAAPGVAGPSASVAPPAPVSAAPQNLPPLDANLMRQFYAEDPEGAGQLTEAWNRLDATQRAQQTRRFSAAVPILSEVARLPVEQRAAAVRSQADFLVSNGWTPEQIEHFAADPSDLNIRMLLRMGVPIAEQRQFFAPLEGAPGAVYRDATTLAPIAANPTPPRQEQYSDAEGNLHSATVPGSPAIGPGANLFGAGTQGGQAQPAPQRRTATNPQTGERITVEYNEQTGQWQPVTEAPAFRPAPGGPASGQGGFPR